MSISVYGCLLRIDTDIDTIFKICYFNFPMAKKTTREKNYGKYIFRRKRKGITEIFARVGYYDKNGQWKYKYEKATSEDDAVIRAAKIINDYQKRGSDYIDGTNLSFEDFADWYKAKYVIEPTYEQGQQIAGLRTYRNVRLQIERLKLEFPKKKISKIDEDVLHAFKNKRKNLDKVKTATINRDLELLRAMFGKAVKQGWLEESPFARAENLIRKSLEARRKVTTSLVEEKLVLEAAKNSDNKYLYPLVLALRDTGARPSELYPYAAYGLDLETLPEKIKNWLETEVTADAQVYLPLCWFQLFKVDFSVVPLISLKSRQVEFRFATMTARLKTALIDLWETTKKEPIALVFPFKTVSKDWQKVREDTKLLDLRIRDWRRIYATNADMAGIPDKISQRLLGHKLLSTTYRYSEADLDSTIEAARLMDERNLISDAMN